MLKSKVYATVFWFSFILISISFIRGQELRGEFKDKFFAGKSLFLLEQKGGNFFFYDSVRIDETGQFTFGIGKHFPGYYRLVTGTDNWFDIILNPKEKEVNLVFNQTGMKDDFEILLSNENKALKNFGPSLKQLNVDIMNTIFSLSELTSSGKSESEEFEKKLKKLRNKKITLLNDITKIYPGTYFLKVAKVNGPSDVANRRSRKDSFFLSGFLSSSDFIRSNLIPNKIREYLNYYTVLDNAGYKSSIDDILLNAGANPEVYLYCLEYLIDFFDSENLDDVFEYVLDEYVDPEDDAMGELSDYIKNRIEGFNNLKLGKTIPDAVIMNSLGTGISIASVASMNEKTLIFFWSSSCPHCVKILPELKALYSAYNQVGFDIVGISLDIKKEEWYSSIYKNELHWVNLSDLRGWNSPLVDLFYLARTPTFLIVDRDMKIVGRPGHWKEIASFLEEWNPEIVFNVENLVDDNMNNLQTLSPEVTESINFMIEDFIMSNPEIIVRSLNTMEKRKIEQEETDRAVTMKQLENEIKYDPNDPVGGNPDGDITIVEFFDYRCGICRRFSDDLHDFVSEDGNIRLVYKELPILGPLSELAASAGLAANRQGIYKEFHRRVMGSSGFSNEEDLFTIAQNIGLDIDELKTQMENEIVQNQINSNLNLAELLIIQGTPSLIVGDQFIGGRVSKDDLKAIINEIRR